MSGWRQVWPLRLTEPRVVNQALELPESDERGQGVELDEVVALLNPGEPPVRSRRENVGSDGGPEEQRQEGRVEREIATKGASPAILLRLPLCRRRNSQGGRMIAWRPRPAERL